MSATRAVRDGSYSIDFTVATTPSFFRLKSTLRSICLCPPPRNRTVTIPWLLRPPLFFRGDSNDFSGWFTFGCVQSAKSLTDPARRPAEVGLYCRMPMIRP